jgi:acetyl-CoA acetyltransferase
VTDVFVVGAGMTPLGKHYSLSVKDLTAQAVRAALADAGCEISQIEAAWFANTRWGIFEGQHNVRGQVALRPLGMENVPIFNTDNACASSSAAFNLACAYLRAGMASVALVVGTEKMNYPENRDAMFAAFLGSMDRTEGERQLREAIARFDNDDSHKSAGSLGGSHSIYMDYYAATAREHMRRYGTTQRQIAAVASKNHGHSSLNPMAHYRMKMTIDEILADKEIVWPLTRSMCAPLTDGAGALILCSEHAIGHFDRRRAVRVRATQVTTGATAPRNGAVPLAIRRAYEEAGLGPQDLSLAEVHDASAFGEITQIENLGLCESGAGGFMAERGETALGGRIPINPSGGLESKGHPTAASGAIQLHELVTQLRGEAGPRQIEGARIALAENGGGFYDGEEAAAAVTVLERP